MNEVNYLFGYTHYYQHDINYEGYKGRRRRQNRFMLSVLSMLSVM